MNIKTTIVLLILAGGAVLLFWQGPQLAPKLGLAPKPQQTGDAKTIETLKNLPVDDVTEVVIAVPGRPEVTLKGHPLELLGNWPIRRAEVNELLATLKDLKSRYYSIPLDDKTDLQQFGLAPGQKPIEVTVITTNKHEYKMKFGEAPIKADENPFTRAAYVHLEGENEVVRLGPQVIPILRRDEETYRKRQLFPEANRVRIVEPKPPFPPPDMENQPPDSKPNFLLNDDAVQIVIESPSGRLVLHRHAPNPKEEVPADKPEGEAVIQPLKLADSWEIAEPVRDRANPDKLRAILTALPNLWLEKFVEVPPVKDTEQKKDKEPEPKKDEDYFFGLGKHTDLVPKLFTLLGGSIPTGLGDNPLRTVINLATLPEAKSESAKVTVTFKDGKSRTLQIGRVSRSVGRDDLRFAKIEDNPLVFELKADRLNDLELSFSKSSFGGPSSPLDEVRDPTLVRFDPSNVVSVEIADKTPTGERITKLEKKDDNWNMVLPVAEPALKTEVTDLLKQLQDMQSQKRDIIDGRDRSAPTLAALGGLANIDPLAFLGLAPGEAKKITLTFAEKSGKKPVSFLIGRRDSKSNKRGVIVEGRSRINLVDDRAENNVSRLDQQPSAYRAPKLFDRSKSQIGEVIVQREATPQHPADTYTLKEEDQKTAKWAVAAPFKAEADTQTAGRLVGALTQIDAPKYVYDPKTDAPLASTEQWQRFLLPLGGLASAFDPSGESFFGLAKPALTITLKFREPKGAEDVVIEIGRAKSPTEYYARRKGTTPLFLVPAIVAQSADHKPEEMVDRSLINLPSNAEVQTFRRTMNGQEMEIAQNNSALWEITKPSPAKADQTTVDELVNGVRQLRAARIEAVNPKELKPEYGLNPPVGTVTIEALEKSKSVEKVLLIGNPVDSTKPDGERYVKAQGSTMVAVISGDLAKKLTAPPSKYRDLNLAGFVNADKIVIQRPDRTVTFVKGPSGWKMKEPLETDAEDQNLRDLHDSLAKLRAEEIVEDKPKDLANYGLDKPANWRLFNGDKEVLHLLVGNREKIGADKKADGFRVYAKLAKGDSVVLLDPLLTSRLTEEYRKRDLWPALPEKEITEVSIKAPNPKDSFNFVRGTLGWIDTDKPADKLDLMAINDLTFTLSQVKVERYVVDKGADLKKFGLDKPKILTITTMNGKKHTLLLGDLLEGKRLYAKLDDPLRTDVFLLNDFDTRAINRPRSDFFEKPKEPKKEPELKKETPKKTADSKKEIEFKKGPEIKKVGSSKDTEPKKDKNP